MQIQCWWNRGPILRRRINCCHGRSAVHLLSALLASVSNRICYLTSIDNFKREISEAVVWRFSRSETYEHDNNVGVGVLAQLSQPSFNVLKSQIFGDVVDQESARRTAIIPNNQQLWLVVVA